MTEDHRKFLIWLYDRAPFVAEALAGHWYGGRRYYIDKRVNIAGKRREFDRLNSQFKEE